MAEGGRVGGARDQPGGTGEDRVRTESRTMWDPRPAGRNWRGQSEDREQSYVFRLRPHGERVGGAERQQTENRPENREEQTWQ